MPGLPTLCLSLSQGEPAWKFFLFESDSGTYFLKTPEGLSLDLRYSPCSLRQTRSCVIRIPPSSAAQSLYLGPFTEGSLCSTPPHASSASSWVLSASFIKLHLRHFLSKRPALTPPKSSPNTACFSVSLSYMLLTFVLTQLPKCLLVSCLTHGLANYGQ